MKRSFSRVAIVNRGEAALRFINAALEFNREGERLHTIALYTEAERARAVRQGGRRGLRPRAGDHRRGPTAGARSPTSTSRGSSARCARRAPRPPGPAGASSPSSRRSSSCASRSASRSSARPPRRCARSATRSSAKRLAEGLGIPVVPWAGRGGGRRGAGGARRPAALGFPVVVKAARRQRRPRRARGRVQREALPGAVEGRPGRGLEGPRPDERSSSSAGSTACARSTCR